MNLLYLDYSMTKSFQLGSEKIQQALGELDAICSTKFKLIVGGGGALVSAYKFPLMTEDLDAVAVGIEILELGPLVEQVAKKLNLQPDWLNPYFASFMHVLPPDYSNRLRLIFTGNNIQAHALGPEDLFVMKCFAGRDKDIPHARALLKQKNFDLNLVADHLFALKEKRIPGSIQALEFYEELVE